MSCDVAVFDRTDHVEEPMTPPATEPEPSRTPVSDESDFEEPTPFDWLYDLGDGSGPKARAAYKLIPRAKRLTYPGSEAFVYPRSAKGKGKRKPIEPRPGYNWYDKMLTRNALRFSQKRILLR